MLFELRSLIRLVIHYIDSPEAGVQDLPLLLDLKRPTSQSAGGVGTQIYARPPQAVILGGAYTNDIVEKLRKACDGVQRGVPWLKGGASPDDLEKAAAKDPRPLRERVLDSAFKMKALLIKLLDEDKMGTDGEYVWAVM